ncbi:hypothetical protein GCM10022222_35600 [Amycolatopsis ultiminotia]|uniref:Uncharacterized protein n=1 Tax=Amycolatopsis ultiminotia TaxID=543629 RepID=A0ABP6WD18_9PSEU
MNMRKLAAASVICITGLGTALLASGTAFASPAHEELKGPYPSNDACQTALHNFPSTPDVDGLECIVQDGKIYLDVSYKD